MAQALCAALGVECLFWSTSESSDTSVRGENGEKKMLPVVCKSVVGLGKHTLKIKGMLPCFLEQANFFP